MGIICSPKFCSYFLVWSCFFSHSYIIIILLFSLTKYFYLAKNKKNHTRNRSLSNFIYKYTSFLSLFSKIRSFFLGPIEAHSCRTHACIRQMMFCLKFKMVIKKAIVDIGLRTRTCNRFQLDQLPCGHAIVVLQKANHDPYDYCSPYFTKEAMIHAYEETVFHVGHEDTWEVSENFKSMKVYPPQGRVRVGRQKKRCKVSWEINAKQHEQVKCGSCNQYGHNRRSCWNPPVRVS
ncbi:hypothetical protein DCAR_0727298 [Daucus carota subsp. sativus]|uniref:Zinc finger PMZ-type domain-containing protein n=1 Tax=Daucus carota subsp. sativus TaxID=79200 RepID=A0AAF1B604_DAUCS|nr:hypothetical protein DCAR_0727298 [Daucus carota subsp. sativus]